MTSINKHCLTSKLDFRYMCGGNTHPPTHTYTPATKIDSHPFMLAAHYIYKDSHSHRLRAESWKTFVYGTQCKRKGLFMFSRFSSHWESGLPDINYWARWTVTGLSLRPQLGSQQKALIPGRFPGSPLINTTPLFRGDIHEDPSVAHVRTCECFNLVNALCIPHWASAKTWYPTSVCIS